MEVVPQGNFAETVEIGVFPNGPAFSIMRIQLGLLQLIKRAFSSLKIAHGISLQSSNQSSLANPHL